MHKTSKGTGLVLFLEGEQVMKYKILTWGKLVLRATILKQGATSDKALLPLQNAMNKSKQRSSGAPFKRSHWNLKGAKLGERQME